MTKIFTAAALTAFFFFAASTANAKIWRVNNNTNVAADFTTLLAAHTAASSGDTLHLEGSPTSYGSLTCTKKLFIVGPGFFLDENPGSQALLQTAKVDNIVFQDGSAGSVITGLDFRSSDVSVRSHDIIIRRNKFTSPSGANIDYFCGTISVGYLSSNSNIPVNNVIISQNYGVSIGISHASSGILITNNFIARNGHEGETATSNALYAHPNAIILVQNNIFRRGKIVANNSNFINNIMVAGSLEGTGNLVSNNIGSGTQFGATNGNQSNIAMTTVFAGAGPGVSTDGQWKLKAGSPASGAGYGSTAQTPVDAGMFSGHTPYVLAGLASMPAIYHFENQPVGSNADPIDVTIKVKSAGN